VTIHTYDEVNMRNLACCEQVSAIAEVAEQDDDLERSR